MLNTHPARLLALGALVTLAGCASGSSSESPRPSPHAANPEAVARGELPPGHPPIPGMEGESAPPPLVEGSDFVVFTGDGTPMVLEDVIQAAGAYEVVMLGEEHDDPMTHRLQAALLEGVHQAHPGRSVVLSLEMFETDVQYILDEYLRDYITEDHFKKSARPWERYDTDYRPAVEYAKEHGIPVVAANAPRRYVNRVSRMGAESLDELPESALELLPPLPYPGPSEAYQAEWDAQMGDAAAHMSPTLIDAQTLWDASMAWSIVEAMEGRMAPLVVHLAGAFHVMNHTGTPEALEHYRPGTRTLVVVHEPVSDPAQWDEELAGSGDFVILTREPPDEPAVQ